MTVQELALKYNLLDYDYVNLQNYSTSSIYRGLFFRSGVLQVNKLGEGSTLTPVTEDYTPCCTVYTVEGVPVIKLVADCTVDEELTVNYPCIIDLNGYTLSFTQKGSSLRFAGQDGQVSFMIYGQKPGSKIYSKSLCTIFTKYRDDLQNAPYVAVPDSTYTVGNYQVSNDPSWSRVGDSYKGRKWYNPSIRKSGTVSPVTDYDDYISQINRSNPSSKKIPRISDSYFIGGSYEWEPPAIETVSSYQESSINFCSLYFTNSVVIKYINFRCSLTSWESRAFNIVLNSQLEVTDCSFYLKESQKSTNINYRFKIDELFFLYFSEGVIFSRNQVHSKCRDSTSYFAFLDEVSTCVFIQNQMSTEGRLSSSDEVKGQSYSIAAWASNPIIFYENDIYADTYATRSESAYFIRGSYSSVFIKGSDSLVCYENCLVGESLLNSQVDLIPEEFKVCLLSSKDDLNSLKCRRDQLIKMMQESMNSDVIESSPLSVVISKLSEDINNI